ncbi:hypothetical protein QQ045_000247 [Rhodiola kirilowii]
MAHPALAGSPADEERLEFRSSDDAWYDVDLSRDGDRLIIKCRWLSSEFDEVYEPGNFKTVEDVSRFRDSFRTSSLQVQDDECRKIVPGIKVCAASSFADNDLRYFDAIVEKVNQKEHFFRDEEEQCLCSFTLSWQNGPNAGLSATVGIESICFLRDGPLNQTLVDFLRMARTAVVNPSKDSTSLPVPITDTTLDIEPSIPDVMHESTQGQEVPPPTQQLGTTSQQLKDQDTCSDKSVADVSPNIPGRCHYVLAIENMEKDLSTSTVTKFIHKETNIFPEAHIFPSLKTDLFTRGILKVHTEREFKKLLEFLENPNHVIVSSRNRPWVVTEMFSGEDYMGTTMEHCNGMESNSELKVICSGTDEYLISKEHKENYTEFNRHQKLVLRRLAFEEEKISRQFGK